MGEVEGNTEYRIRNTEAGGQNREEGIQNTVCTIGQEYEVEYESDNAVSPRSVRALTS